MVVYSVVCLFLLVYACVVLISCGVIPCPAGHLDTGLSCLEQSWEGEVRTSTWAKEDPDVVREEQLGGDKRKRFGTNKESVDGQPTMSSGLQSGL